MKILITTGIYPPKVGGPAQYAKSLKEEFERLGHTVFIKTFHFEHYLPSGLRHLFFFFKIIPSVLKSDIIFILDTFSVGLPSVLISKILGKKCSIRTGGDFLWEGYVERTGKKILFRNFYNTEILNFSLKEKIIFSLTKWTLQNVTHTIFSTNWQREIFVKAYQLDKEKTSIIENYYGLKESGKEPNTKEFVASTRLLVWKNLDILKKVFDKIKTENRQTVLFLDNLPYKQFIEKMSISYAVILVSLGDISPNMILDAIRLNKPFICTKEVGIYDRIKDFGIFVDPLNEREIEGAVLYLLTEEGYRETKEKVKNFNFIHTWDQITEEFLYVANSLK